MAYKDLSSLGKNPGLYLCGIPVISSGKELFMEKQSKKNSQETKRPYQTPKLTTHGDVAKLTQDPWKPKTHGRWADSSISVG